MTNKLIFMFDLHNATQEDYNIIRDTLITKYGAINIIKPLNTTYVIKTSDTPSILKTIMSQIIGNNGYYLCDFLSSSVSGSLEKKSDIDFIKS